MTKLNELAARARIAHWLNGGYFTNDVRDSGMDCWSPLRKRARR
jgi:hypothetical protein